MCKAEPEKKTKLRSWSNTREVNPLNQQHLREDELGGVGVRFVQQLVKNSCNLRWVLPLEGHYSRFKKV